MVTKEAVATLYALLRVLIWKKETKLAAKIKRNILGMRIVFVITESSNKDKKETNIVTAPLKSGCILDVVCFVRILAIKAADAAISSV